MKRLAAAPVLCLVLLSVLPANSPARAGEAETLALHVEQNMGAEAFAAARVLHFTWAVERDGQQVVAYEHTWDRWTGDYRVEGVDRESGKPWLAIFDIDSREGRVWLADEAVPGEALAAHLERAYGRFINDTYWLLMPWKWRDPGVHLARVGDETVNGRECAVVELTFGEVGLTSNDRYRGYVDHETGRMVRWSYVLQDEEGKPGSSEPTVWDWTGWVEVDGVWFSERKERVGGDGPPVAITTHGIELHAEPSAEQLAAWFQQ